jgi:DNA-binding protein Fis
MWLRELILNHNKGLKFNCIFTNNLPKQDKSSEVLCVSDDITLDSVIKNHISNILSKTNGKISGEGGAAQLLGLHPNTLRNKMLKLGLLK